MSEESIFDVLERHKQYVSKTIKQFDTCEEKVYPDQIKFTLTLELLQDLIQSVETIETDHVVILVGEFVTYQFLSGELSKYVNRRKATALYQGNFFGNEIWTDHSLNVIQKDVLIVASITRCGEEDFINNRALVTINCGSRVAYEQL